MQLFVVNQLLAVFVKKLLRKCFAGFQSQPATTYSKLTIKTLEQDVKYVPS